MMAQRGMPGHFARLARVYRGMRTTDEAPILYIRDALAGRDRVRAADIGCGAGRYDLLLFRHIPGLHLTCVDMSAEMLGQLSAHLSRAGVADFETIVASLDDLDLAADSFDCVVTFNAIHHFGFPAFIAKAARAIRPDGEIFVYTRTPEQNAGSVWGRYFPRFCEKETRLFRREEMEAWVEDGDGLRLVDVKTFRYARSASLGRLLEQARNRHYSTFSLYSEAEFEDACAAFEAALRSAYADTDNIVWHDRNIMLRIGR